MLTALIEQELAATRALLAVLDQEYAALREYFASRGIDWPDDPSAFNAAG